MTDRSVHAVALGLSGGVELIAIVAAAAERCSGAEPRRFALHCQQWGNMRPERHTPGSSFRKVTEVVALLFSLLSR